MPYSLYCSDLGVPCDHVSEGRTEDELLRNVRDHAKEAHGIQDFPPEMLTKINRLVKEDKAA
jgi:predicted small metal-binding protein